MDHSAYNYMTHDFGRPHQDISQHHDRSRYFAEHQRPDKFQVDVNAALARETLYKRTQNMEGAYPYQYGHPQAAMAYIEEAKQMLPSAQTHASQTTRPAVQDFSQMTAIQQRQEYLQRLARHQQMLQQREYAAAAQRVAAEQANKIPGRHRASDVGPSEHYDTRARHSAFSVPGTAGTHQQGQKVEGQTSIDALLRSGFTQQQSNSNHVMMTRNIGPRQYNQQQEQYAPNPNQAKPPMQRDPKDVVLNKLRERHALREWETHGDQKYASERTQSSTNYSHTATTSQQVGQQFQPDQLDTELARLKDVVRQMEMLKEQRNKYKSSAFQYLEKVGSHEVTSERVASFQPTQNSPGSARKSFTSSYHSMPPHHSMPPPPHQHVSSPPKYNETLSSQKSTSAPNRYLIPTDRQQMALYQQHQTHSPPHRHYPTHQLRQHHQQNVMRKKEISPIQMVTQGLPKIVDVRSLANVAAATAMETSMSSLNRSKRRVCETLLGTQVGDSRMMRMRRNSSPEGYSFEVSDTRSADSSDSGVESLASPEAQISGHMYNRSALVLAQQQQLEIAKAQHAASFDAMKRNQQTNRQPHRFNTKNVRLERAGSPLKLSDLMEKEQICPTVFKELDTLTCKCQACVTHQEKTEIELRGLWRERKIKKYPPALHLASIPKTSSTSSSTKCSSQQKEVILIEDNESYSMKGGVQNEKGETDKTSRKRLFSSTNDTPGDAKRLKITNSPELKNNNEALDLSKKQATNKYDQCNTEYEQSPLDLKVHPKYVNGDDRRKENNDILEENQAQSRSLTVEQVIKSCMGQVEEEKDTYEVMLHHDEKTTSVEQMITACIDQEDQFFETGDVSAVENLKPLSGKDHLNPSKPICAEDSAEHKADVDNSNARKINTENLETNKCITMKEDNITNNKINNKKSIQQSNESQCCSEDLRALQELSKQNKECSNDAEVLEIPMQNQVRLTGLKIMVEKLKVNTDMLLPEREDMVPEQQTLQRTSSFPTLKSKVSEEVQEERKRAQSVGLSNNMSAMSDASARSRRQKQTGKDHQFGIFMQQQHKQENERPLSAPACGNHEMVSELNTTGEKQVHTLTSLFQTKLKDLTYIPQNLRDCWDDKTSNENRKAKEIGSPKMQWKAQWAKDKKCVDLPEKSLCEICGTASSFTCGCKDRVKEEPIEKCQDVRNIQQLNSIQMGLEEEQSTQLATPASETTPEKDNLNVMDVDNSKTEKTIKLASLFQPKQFKYMMNASCMPLSTEEKSVSDKEIERKNSIPPGPNHHLPAQTTPLSLIKGKQHGKATIFHKQPKTTEPKPDHQAINLVTHKQSDSKQNSSIVEQDKQDDKQFPRLALSPTALLDNWNSDPQDESMAVTSDSNQNVMVAYPPAQGHVKNVLRVMPKFRHHTPTKPKVSSSVPKEVQTIGIHSAVQTSAVKPVVQSAGAQSELAPEVQHSVQALQPLVAPTAGQPTLQSVQPSPDVSEVMAPTISRVETTEVESVVKTSIVQPGEERLKEFVGKQSNLSIDMQTPMTKPDVQTSTMKLEVKASIGQTSIVQPAVQPLLNTSLVQSSTVQSIVESPVVKYAEQKPTVQSPMVQRAKTPSEMLTTLGHSTEEPSNRQPVVKTSMVQPMVHEAKTPSVQSPVIQPETENSEVPLVQMSVVQPVVHVSTEQPVVEISKVSMENPVVPTSTGKSVVQMSTGQPMVESSSEEPLVQASTEKSVELAAGQTVVQTSKDQSALQTSTGNLAAHVSAGQPVIQGSNGKIQSSCEQSVVRVSTGQAVVQESSTKQTVTTGQPMVQTVQGQSMVQVPTGQSDGQVSTGQSVVQRVEGISVMDMSNGQPVVKAATEQPVEQVSKGQTEVSMEKSAVQTSSAEEVMVQPSVIKPVVHASAEQQASTEQIIQASNDEHVLQTSVTHSVVQTSTTLKVHMTMTEPVVRISTVHAVMPTSTVQPVVQMSSLQPVMQTAPMEHVPQLQFVGEKAVQNLPPQARVEATHSNGQVVIPTSLANANRRLKSNAPHIHVPTTNGYSRYQKDNHNMREIYRVEMYDDAQPLDLKVVPKKKQTVSAYKVIYLQHSFPCVLRSEIPFVPPQMLQEAFFAAVDYGEFNYALQKCGIMHRYMTMHEQGAMSRACVTRSWNGSCKLVPLDLFDAKFEQITNLLEQSEGEQ